MLAAMSTLPPLAESADVRGVVVGFDSSPAARIALQWAAHAATAYDLPLTVLYAQPDAEAEICDFAFALQSDMLAPDVAASLTEAERSVAEEHPELRVSTIIHPESPVDALLTASHTANLVVIGSRGLGGFSGLLLGSTAMEVTPYAQCPVVVLYVPDERTADAIASAPHRDSVVIAYDGSDSSCAALRFGLRHAHLTAHDAVIVYVDNQGADKAPTPTPPDDPSLPEQARADLARAVELTRDFPSVPVAFMYGVGRPAGILIKEAAGAALAVVGARGRGGFTQLMLGSVGMQMLLHAECPLALVHQTPHD